MFVAMLAANQALPFIDRAALHTLARYEAAKESAPSDARAPTGRADRVQGLCGQAAKLSGPVDLLSDVRQAYAMSAPKASILRSTCAVLRSDTNIQTASR